MLLHRHRSSVVKGKTQKLTLPLASRKAAAMVALFKKKLTVPFSTRKILKLILTSI